MEIDLTQSGSDGILIPARRGKALRVTAGTLVRVINTHGTQVVDAWALNGHDTHEWMSMEHTRASLRKLNPGRGDVLLTNHRRPIVSIEEDTTPGVHDSLIAACDRYRYQLLGVSAYHDNCSDNFVAALHEVGVLAVAIPCPLNLFMNIPADSSGHVEFRAPVSQAGQYVGLRAHMDAVLVFSACPQDMLPVNGEHMTPTEVHLSVE
jgi:uncharacterized protein YcgI (DUF1989 family)